MPSGRIQAPALLELRQSTLLPSGASGLFFYAMILGLALVFEGVGSSKEEFNLPPLDDSNDSIRLLTLHPGGWGDSIKCELSVTTFSSKPEYEALSYAWGDSKATKAIWVNGVKVQIKENLRQALYHLRHDKEQRVLWTDALCINQAKTDEAKREKNKQVPLMAFIYRRAQNVLIWLGNHEPPAGVGRRLQRPHEWYDDSTPWKKSAGWKKVEPFLWQLIHREYWKRAWIIQEVGMASKIHVFYGHDSLAWTDFILWTDRYRRLNPTDVAVDRIFTLNDMWQSKYRDTTMRSLGSLVDDFRDSFCERPHDKIYAFLGLAYDQFNNPIPVEYEKSLYEVYRDAVRFHCTPPPLERIDKSIELVYYSALVRRLLTRKGVQRPKRGRTVLGEFDEEIRLAEKRNSVQAASSVPAAEPEPPRVDKDKEPASRDRYPSSSFHKSYSIETSYNYAPYYVAPRTSNQHTSATEHNRQKAEKRSNKGEEKEQESQKAEEPDYRYALIAGALAVLGASAIYYYIWGKSRPDVPKEWHWKVSGAEDIATWTEDSKSTPLLDKIPLRGVIVGQVKHLGPSTISISASHDATMRWIASFSDYLTHSDVKKARGLNEKLLKILNDPKDFRTRNITSLQSASNDPANNPRRPINSAASSQESAHLFLGTNGILGVIPPNAREGDLICQFWNSNACAVLRRPTPAGRFSRFWTTKFTEPRYELVGRAAIVSTGGDVDWDVPKDKDRFKDTSSVAVELALSLTDLTRLSLDTVNLPGTK
ncbi:hypothetical protein ACEPPN_019282 [Leptodophora sp. 'Broadleaf-Isolate-01']